MIASMPSGSTYCSRAGLAALVLALATGGAGVPTPVRAEDWRDLLAAVARNAGASTPARADVQVKRGDGTPAAAVMLVRRHVVYLETRAGLRALIRPGKVVVLKAGRVERAPVGAPLDGTDLLLEDLVPFTVRRLAVPQVSDDGPAGVVVTGAPTPPSAYVLLVFTADPEHRAIVRTKYYRDTITNLVKMRRDGTFIDVGGHWRPGVVDVEQFRPPSTTQLTLAWRPDPTLPATVFSLKGLRQPSPVTWPAS